MPTCPDCLDAANLRKIFNKAAETFPKQYLLRDGNNKLTPLGEWWSELYFGIIQNEEGLSVCKEIQLFKDELARYREKYGELDGK